MRSYPHKIVHVVFKTKIHEQILDVSHVTDIIMSRYIHSSQFNVTTCQATQLWDCHMYKSWRDNLPTRHLHMYYSKPVLCPHQHHIYNNNNSGPQTHHKNAFSTSNHIHPHLPFHSLSSSSNGPNFTTYTFPLFPL